MISSAPRDRIRKHVARGASVGRHHSDDSRNGTPPPRPTALRASVLALNRHFVAIHVLPAQRAFTLLCKGSAEVINVEQNQYLSYDFDGWREVSELKAALEERDETDDWIRTVRFEIQVPRVIRLLRYDRVPRNTVKFNRRNILLRDDYCCQYCDVRFPRQQLSLDHVVPRSRGGEDSWENVVCACLECNVRKGGRTPQEAGMMLKRPPMRPRRSPLISRQLSQRKYASWEKFVLGPD